MVRDPRKASFTPLDRAIPRDAWTASLAAQGMPPAFIAPFTEMEDGFNSGWIDFGVAGTEAEPGTMTPAQLFAHAHTSPVQP